MIKISQNGINMIKQFESFRSKSYLCPAGVWTIGYGTTVINGRPVTRKMTCTEEEAETWLYADVDKFAEGVEKYINPEIELNQNQVDAILSFVYNIGLGNFKKSTFLKYLNDGFFVLAKDEFKKWNKGGGKVLPGLVERRRQEADLFNSTEGI